MFGPITITQLRGPFKHGLGTTHNLRRNLNPAAFKPMSQLSACLDLADRVHRFRQTAKLSSMSCVQLARSAPSWGDLPVEIWERVIYRVLKQDYGIDVLELYELQELIKLSAVSCTVARAAANVLYSSMGLCVTSTHGLALLFRSSLMLRWAPHMRCLTLWAQEAYTWPGLPAFLQAAVDLHRLLVVCLSAVEAAQVSRLLHSCSAGVVEVYGAFVPGRFPVAMKALTVDFDIELDPGFKPEWDPQTPSILLYHLLAQQQLTSLSLDMENLCQFVLACPEQLPRLDVQLTFRLQAESDVDLSWLQHQPCSLSLTMDVRTQDVAAHEAVLEQLQSIPVDDLQLKLSVPLPAQVQVLWQQVTVIRSCRIFVSRDSCSEVLQALPRCPSITIRVGPSQDKTAALSVSWPALLAQTSKVWFQAVGVTLRLVGRCELPAGERWQLSVAAGCQEVHGLPDICRQADGSYLVQNSAAIP